MSREKLYENAERSGFKEERFVETAKQKNKNECNQGLYSKLQTETVLFRATTTNKFQLDT